jgi:hypothetical protein
MLRGKEGIEHAVDARVSASGDCPGLWREMSRVRAGKMKLTLKVGQSDVEIFHRHVRSSTAFALGQYNIRERG